MNIGIIIIYAFSFSMIYFAIASYRGYKRVRNKYFDLMDEFLQEKIANSENLKKYQEYTSFFRTYYNEDWNRDTPFLEKIEALQIFFNRGDERIYPLSTLCKDISISKEPLEQLKLVFQGDFNTILEMPLGKVLMFSADLKSYREGSSENGDLTPQEFYKWRMKDKINHFQQKI